MFFHQWYLSCMFEMFSPPQHSRFKWSACLDELITKHAGSHPRTRTGADFCIHLKHLDSVKVDQGKTSWQKLYNNNFEPVTSKVLPLVSHCIHCREPPKHDPVHFASLRNDRFQAPGSKAGDWHCLQEGERAHYSMPNYHALSAST